jgi:sodium transport system ATP-binding protein
MIEVTDLHKAFGRVVALRGVSFAAPSGRITGLLGPNGAGKTTTLRILYTLLLPDQGRAEVDGFDVVSETQEVRRRIGALPDNYGLYPRLTTRENVRYYGRLQGMSGMTLESRIESLFSMLEMGEIADRRTQGFSHGQRMKAALARAMVHSPANLLLDEPTTGLDVMSTRSLRALLLRMRDEGTCILFSSHIMQEVAALCDQIVVVAAGRVAAYGTSDDLRQLTGKNNLEDAFVAVLGSGEGFE